MSGKFTESANIIVMGLALIVLAGLLAWLSVRYAWETDWTRGGRHGLSDASRQLLARMDGRIEVTSYAREDAGLRELIRNFINRYQRVKHDMDLKFVNPDTVPDETRNLGISVNGELIVRYRDRLEHVRSDSEQEFTNALQRLLRGTDLWLAFLEGHGERDPLGDNNHDLSAWARQLQQRGLNLQPINLARFGAIPDNTAVLVIASPRTGFLAGETDIILDYLERGGNLLWMLDPGTAAGLDKLREYLGIELPPGTLIDIAGQVIGIDDPSITLATRQLYAPHSVVSGFELTTLFPRAAAVSIDNTVNWRTEPIITSASHTWLEQGELNGDISYDRDQEQAGPFNLAVSLERDINNRQHRVVVIGDSDFISNAFINQGGNLELGLRLIDWLTRDDSFITIPARTMEDANLQLSRLASIIIGFGFLVFLPLGLLTAGGLVWWRRRRL